VLLVVGKVIASACGIDIHAKPGCDYSFFASPYQAHRDFAAVDIYQGINFGDLALSPVDGVVYKTVKFDSPTPTKRSLPEYLTLARNGECIVRMMHFKPSVKEGEEISVGDVIGTSIKNGFFTYWVDPGIHLEIRREKDMLRAKGGLELSPAHPCQSAEPSSSILGTVIDSCARNTKVELSEPAAAQVGSECAALDGTLSLDYAGVYGSFAPGERVFFNGIQIGKMRSAGKHMSTFATEKLAVYANDVPLAGVSFISEGRIMKLLPKKYGSTLFEIGEDIQLTIKR